jgi:transposase, IS30 family
MASQLTVEQRRMARRLAGHGLTLREIGAQVGVTYSTVGLVLAGAQTRDEGRPDDEWVPAPGHLTLPEREEISLGLRGKETFTAIAQRLGRSISTVSREVNSNGGRDDYRAWAAHRRAREQARRPKASKLTCPRLAAVVTEWLEQWWSPEEISLRLRVEFPDDPMMRVSHETIYRSLFVQGRGELRRELTRCLRSGRAQRRPQGRVEKRGRLADMVMISDRPAEADDRAVPGHWEGDLVLGRNNNSAVGTLVERTTGYLLLLHLPDGREADKVDAAMRHAITKLPADLFRSITWDQGKEMARHAAFSESTGIQIYFADPHSPWQRGTNENTNGLLRQYMPKGTDLSVHTAEDLDGIARSLNNRPRKRLAAMKPSERLAELLASTG